MKAIMGWVRESTGKGRVIHRPIKQVCNAITSMVGGGHTGQDGMGNTTPYVLEIYDTDKAGN